MENKSQQKHYGTGDNVARDKIINNYLIGFEDYEKIIEEIDEITEIVNNIPPENIESLIKFQSRLEKLENKKESLKENVYRMYKIFSSFDINTERFSTIVGHIKKGEFSKANEVLNENEISKDIERTKEERNIKEQELREIENKLAQLGAEYAIKANIMSDLDLNEAQFKEVSKYFSKSIDVWKNPEVMYQYGLFLQSNNKLQEALSVYQDTLVLLEYNHNSKQEADLNLMIKTLNLFGTILRDYAEYEYAGMVYKEAISIQERFNKSMTEEEEFELTQVKINLAFIFKDNQQYDNSKTLIKEVVPVIKNYKNKNATEGIVALSDIFNLLAIMYKELNHLQKAGMCYRKAIRVLSKIEKDNREAFLFKKAVILNDYGNFLSKINEEQAAEKYTESISIFEELAKTNKIKYLHYAILVKVHYAGIIIYRKNHKEGLNNLIEAEVMYRNLIEHYNVSYKFHLALVLIHLGEYYLNIQPDKNISIKNAEEAVAILKPYYKKTIYYESQMAQALLILQNNGVDMNKIYV